MLRLLVVEDEPKQRKVLANLIGGIRPEYTVYEAKNGEEALDIVRREEIDVVFTDIRMPRMDGLEFLDRLGDLIKKIKVVILSVYNYFEYAQTALSLGAFGYLLKPIVEKDIVQILAKIELVIEEERRQDIERKNLIEQLNVSAYVYFEHLLSKWVTGTADQNEIDEVKAINPIWGRGCVICSQINNDNTISREYTNDELNEIKHNIRFWMKDILNALGHSISFFLFDDEKIMVTLLYTHQEENIKWETLIKKTNEFINSMKIDYNFVASIGISPIYPDISSIIVEAFQKSKYALSMKFYLGHGKPIIYNDSYIPFNSRLIVQYAEEKELNNCIRLLKVEESLKLLELIKERLISKDGYILPEYFIDSIAQVLFRQLYSLKDIISEQEFQDFMIHVNKTFNIEVCFDIDETINHACYIVNNLIKAFNSKRSEREDYIIDECIGYINKYYYQDISLKTLAEKFHYNISYFSVYFKNNVGMGFADYLTKIRLEKAKELLRESKSKVYEISSLVGYQNTKYFIKVFKSNVGLTPDEYRRIASEK